ncbi:MAG: hypothetical protein ACOVO7_14355, partial [Microcystis aeruginosa]
LIEFYFKLIICITIPEEPEFSPGKSLNPIRFLDLFSQPYLGSAEKVGAKHSDRKSTVSAIGYCPNASPVQDAIADQDVRFLSH